MSKDPEEHRWPVPTLSVVVPVYRGEATVGELVAALVALEDRVEGGLEVVLVDDGSPDESLAACHTAARAARRASADVVVVELARNFGEHHAVLAGLATARGRWVVTMDDDLQNPPGEVLRLLAHAQATAAEVVYTRYETKHHAPWRNVGSQFANRTAEWAFAKPKGLYLSSFRCLSRWLVDQLVAHRGPFPHIDALVFQTTRSFETLLVEHRPRARSKSGYSAGRLMRLWLTLATAASERPLRAALGLGLGLSGLGVLGIVAVLVEELLYDVPVPGWASLMVVLLFFSGVNLLMLGVVGEYVGRVFATVSERPPYVVRRTTRPADRAGADRAGAGRAGADPASREDKGAAT